MDKQNSDYEAEINNLLAEHEKEIRRDIVNHISGNSTRNSGITQIIFNRKFKQFIYEHTHREVQRALDTYQERILKKADDAFDAAIDRGYELGAQLKNKDGVGHEYCAPKRKVSYED